MRIGTKMAVFSYSYRMSCTLLSLIVLLSVSSAASTSNISNKKEHGDEDACRSNHTHIAWRSAITTLTSVPYDTTRDTGDAEVTTLSRSRRLHQRDDPEPSTLNCSWQTRSEAEMDAYRFLRQNVMTFDLPFLETLGFDDEEEPAPDGLSGGLIGPTIQYAVEAKIQFRYADELPLDIWQEYVLNYANLNEGRTNWRPFLWNSLRVFLNPDDTVQDVVKALNTDMWQILAPAGTDCITFVPSETPLIFDPMSVLVFGHASCTGLAILFVTALRTAGVAARVAGTPAWHQEREGGNHDWVEVWEHGNWKFLEPSPNQTIVDTLDRDPCERWFCSRTRFSYQANTTLVSAARLRSVDTEFFRLAWEWNNADVPAEDMSELYQSTCSQCP
jgi:transglutaminase-like putative cysteine protease